MIKLRHIFVILVLVLSPSILRAQNNEVKLGLRTGYNAALGTFGAVSVETTQNFRNNFSIDGGLQYNTIGKAAFEAHPAYSFQFEKCRLSVETLLSYNNISSINSIAIGAGANIDYKSITGKLGYFYRLFGGKGGFINEPFNIYYELNVHCLKKIEKWDLDLIITNCELFELERHYQPSFIAEGSYYPLSKMGISLGIGCKPAGMFNISADYYQSYIKAGVCYRW